MKKAILKKIKKKYVKGKLLKISLKKLIKFRKELTEKDFIKYKFLKDIKVYLKDKKKIEKLLKKEQWYV